MKCHNSKVRSRCSSSSSGSQKLIAEGELEKKMRRITPNKDLFDLLIDEAELPDEQ
jgi:hypothetical protein